MTKTIIDDRLQALGITKNYKGYHKLKLAWELALEDEFRLYAVSKRLYKPVAEKCGCTSTSVERNIRTITDNVWKLIALKEQITQTETAEYNAKIFTDLIEKYINITELNARILNELIEKIVVHEKEIINGENIRPLRYIINLSD